MSEEPGGDRPGRTASGAARLLLFVALLVVVAVLVVAETFNLGIGHGRRSLAGGYFTTLGRDMTLGIGVVMTVLLGVLAISQRRRRPRVGVLIAVCLAVAWPGWAAGYAVALNEGPAAGYSGSARISAGSQVLGSVPVGCGSVVGDPALLAGIGMQTNGFQLDLRTGLDRTFRPGISGEVILPGVTVSFGTISFEADAGHLDASGYVPIDDVVENGLEGRASVSAVVTPDSGGPGSQALVTIEWTCDPATRTYP